MQRLSGCLPGPPAYRRRALVNQVPQVGDCEQQCTWVICRAYSILMSALGLGRARARHFKLRSTTVPAGQRAVFACMRPPAAAERVSAISSTVSLPRALPRLKPCALVPPAGLPPPAHSHPTREWFHDGQLIHAAEQLQPDWPARPASGGRQAAAAPGAAGGPAVPGNPGLSPCGCVTPRMLRPRLDACRRLRHPPFSGRCSPPGTFCLLPAAPKLFQADAPLDQMDPEIAGIIRNEKKRQVLPQRRAVLSAGLPLPATQPRPTAAQPPLRGCGVGCSGPW